MVSQLDDTSKARMWKRAQYFLSLLPEANETQEQYALAHETDAQCYVLIIIFSALLVLRQNHI